jgi:hypothetical protein
LAPKKLVFKKNLPTVGIKRFLAENKKIKWFKKFDLTV